jgi:hypothetical protein
VRDVHVTTNIAIELDEEAGTAVSRAYFTVLQALPGLPLQPIVSGRYHDRFERSAGQWRFAERQVRIDLTGDVSRHLRHPRPLPGLTSARWLLSQNGQSSPGATASATHRDHDGSRDCSLSWWPTQRHLFNCPGTPVTWYSSPVHTSACLP